ncbi:MAG: helix-turn-helix domain-containing protein [Spirochaetia bacterium]|nr:helix-turn-helix domain-containing protein [Spirochaetia bacterium]
MYSGITLVNKIDILLNELGMSRKDFAKQIEINPSTVSTWKTRNIIPPSETLFNITQYFEVSLDWLITEDVHQGIRDFQHTITLRKQIREKIYDIISKKQGIPNGENIDTHNKFF